MICKIKDQFCLRTAEIQCASCRELCCDHCAEIITTPPQGEGIPMARMCHQCLRKTEDGRALADAHIAKLGGVIEKTPKKLWKPLRK